jgi:hypothetical protein
VFVLKYTAIFRKKANRIPVKMCIYVCTFINTIVLISLMTKFSVLIKGTRKFEKYKIIQTLSCGMSVGA